MNKRISLTQYLSNSSAARQHPPSCGCCSRWWARLQASLSREQGALGDVLRLAGSENVQGEVQKKLDIISNEVLIEANEWGGHLAAMAQRGDGRHPRGAQPLPAGRVPAAVRPAGRLEQHRRQRVHRHHLLGAEEAQQGQRGVSGSSDFLQPGVQQAAAGYCIYGPQTTLVLTVGDGVAMFTLDREMGSWVLTPQPCRSPGHQGIRHQHVEHAPLGRRR